VPRPLPLLLRLADERGIEWWIGGTLLDETPHLAVELDRNGTVTTVDHPCSVHNLGSPLGAVPLPQHESVADNIEHNRRISGRDVSELPAAALPPALPGAARFTTLRRLGSDRTQVVALS
jgi:hypothetical protein